MTEITSREQMLDVFSTLHSSFMTTRAYAHEQEQKLEQAQSEFRQRMHQHTQQAQGRLSRENPLQTQLKQIVTALAKTERNWQQTMEGYEKGLEFRQHFGDSLLVFVYGKVKSGKSSLGNYIAWGHTQPSLGQKQHHSLERQPEYFTAANTYVANGDAEDEAKQNRHFRVGATEATSSIQGFCLSGLTWVDSPGLHSAMTQNGKLAQEYVQYADLIIYTMASDSPGRATDLAELKALKDQGKRVLILVTGSDTVEEDENELGEIIKTPVMKASATRQEQRDYVMAACKEAGFEVDRRDIISVSARYAELYPDDADKMQDSGMTALFQRLARVSQAEGVQLKRSAPLRNFGHYLGACEAELQPYLQLLSGFRSEISQLERSVPKIMARCRRQAQQQLRAEIDNTFRITLEPLREDPQALNHALSEAALYWNAQLEAQGMQAIEQGLAELSDDLAQATDQAWQHTALELPPFVVDTVHKEVTVSYHRSTRRRNSGWAALIGASVGFVVAGPVGAAIGATGGSMLGHASGRDACANTRTIELQVGDNLEIMHKQISDQYAQALAQRIEQHAQPILTEAFTQLQTVINQLAEQISGLKIRINALKLQTETSLSQGAQ